MIHVLSVVLLLLAVVYHDIFCAVKNRFLLSPESLNIERHYSCRATLNFEPVAPQATGGISQINKSSLVVHMCAHG